VSQLEQTDTWLPLLKKTNLRSNNFMFCFIKRDLSLLITRYFNDGDGVRAPTADDVIADESMSSMSTTDDGVDDATDPFFCCCDSCGISVVDAMFMVIVDDFSAVLFGFFLLSFNFLIGISNTSSSSSSGAFHLMFRVVDFLFGFLPLFLLFCCDFRLLLLLLFDWFSESLADDDDGRFV